MNHLSLVVKTGAGLTRPFWVHFWSILAVNLDARLSFLHGTGVHCWWQSLLKLKILFRVLSSPRQHYKEPKHSDRQRSFRSNFYNELYYLISYIKSAITKSLKLIAPAEGFSMSLWIISMWLFPSPLLTKIYQASTHKISRRRFETEGQFLGKPSCLLSFCVTFTLHIYVCILIRFFLWTTPPGWRWTRQGLQLFD